MRSRRVILLALCAAAFAAATLAPSARSGQKRPSPASVVRTYFNAYNKHDGQTMCSNFTPELRSWFVHFVSPLFFRRTYPCTLAVIGMIGYTEDAGSAFEHLKVLSTEAQIRGSRAEVDVRARYRYKAFSGKQETSVSGDKIYLFKRSGRWLIAKPGAVYFATQSASGAPSSMSDPPIPDKGSDKPAPQLPASFACSSWLLGDVPDPADAPRSIDIRRVWASVNGDGSDCLGFTFASPPRPGTELYLEISLEARAGGELLLRPHLRIGAGGSIYGLDQLPAGSEAGWKDGQMLLRWPSPNDAIAGAPFGLKARTRFLQIWEPEIKRPLGNKNGEDDFHGQFGIEAAKSG